MRYSPDHPLNLEPATVYDWRELARRRLPRQIFDYIDGGAYQEVTLQANETDLKRIQLRQLVLRDVSERSQGVVVLGQELDAPIILAPVGLGGLYARKAEIAAASAGELHGIPFVESTLTIASIEEVANAVSRPPWFQLYVMRDRGYAERLMARASAVGCPVLVLTVDFPVVGARHRDRQNGIDGEIGSWSRIRRYLDLVSHPKWLMDVGLRSRPHVFGNLTDAVPDATSPDEFRRWVNSQFDPSVDWADIGWIRDHWEGKLVLKGILDAEDARMAQEAGVDGIIVSNHGGRQLDSVSSTVRSLPQIADAIGDSVDVLADGGVRSGIDVAKFVALGAKAVLIGRAWAWAVAGGGSDGVNQMLTGLRSDLDTALGLTGSNSVNELDRSKLLVGETLI